MNRLGFADFHAKHFGPEQKEHWQSMLQQQQHQYHMPQQQQQQQYYGYSQQQQPEEESYYNNENYEEYAQEDEGVEGEEEYKEEEFQLSKEVIEIFRFSEAYRKEREEERLREEQDDQEGMNDWQYDESTVHVSGGIEAPATSLVLTNKKKEEKSSKIAIQEELLNSAYLSFCASSSNDAPVILWPVLPFKM